VPSYPEFRRLIHPDDLPFVDEAVTTGLAMGMGYSLELRIIRPDGVERIVHQKCRIFTETKSGEQYFLRTTEDITERRRSEKEKEKLQEQLLQAQKMESVGRLTGGVAHDFNNMFSVILGHAELAMTKVEGADRRRP
jgi:two-component system, cell cycle sensor histidine kinase and response regulator CckA